MANKIINGDQCRLAWYVDDNLLSHVDPKIVDEVLSVIESYFPELVIERGTKLNHLGMELDFFEKGKVKIGTVQHLTNMIQEFEEELQAFGENIDRHYERPASRWLFKVNKSSNAIVEDKAEIFCKYVAKMIWVMKRSRPGTEPTVSFLCQRMKEPDTNDWHKFKRMMCWIKETVNDVRIIGADNLLKLLVMIDLAHAVHPNMQGHTGGITTFGTGIIDQNSAKQKINSRSFTETEHIGTSEYLSKALFIELFMKAQVYEPKIVLAKDNVSEIRMLVNGKDSCTSNTKHIAIKYFWSTDRIKNGHIEVKYCPTAKMLADFMSKPGQRSLFKLFSNVIMG